MFDISTDVFRQSRFIDNSIDNIQKSLFEGSVFVIIVLFFFLMNFRTTDHFPRRSCPFVYVDGNPG